MTQLGIPSLSIPDGAFPVGSIPFTGLTLAYTPAEVLTTYLINMDELTNPANDESWPVYIHRLPDGKGVQNNILAVFNTGGVIDGKFMNGTITQHRGIQIRCRATSEKTGYLQLQGVVDFLIPVHNAEVYMTDSAELYQILAISQMSDIVPIMEDDRRRTHLTVNLLMCMKRLV